MRASGTTSTRCGKCAGAAWVTAGFPISVRPPEPPARAQVGGLPGKSQRAGLSGVRRPQPVRAVRRQTTTGRMAGYVTLELQGRKVHERYCDPTGTLVGDKEFTA